MRRAVIYHDAASRLPNRKKTAMATVPEMSENPDHLVGSVEHLTREEALDLLDQQSRKFLGMSGAEFVQAYRDGTIEHPHSFAVARVAILLPLADD